MCINYIKIGKNNKGGNLNKKKTKRQNGITLVALVITIIILLILATISIQSLTNTGLFKKAQEAKEKTQNATENQAKTSTAITAKEDALTQITEKETNQIYNYVTKINDSQTNYANQTSLNTGSLAQIGTTADKQCNIFDMASNVYEWTTETSHNSDYPCGFRGGNYYSINFYTSSRNGNNTSESNINIGFRSLLFINV